MRGGQGPAREKRRPWPSDLGTSAALDNAVAHAAGFMLHKSKHLQFPIDTEKSSEYNCICQLQK